MVVSWMIDDVKSPRLKIYFFFYKQLTFNLNVGCLERKKIETTSPKHDGFMVIYQIVT